MQHASPNVCSNTAIEHHCLTLLSNSCRESRKSKGIAYVKFQVPEDALRALRELDMSPFQGRLMHVLPAQRSPAEAATAAEKQREHGQEKVSRRDAKNWALLNGYGLEEF